DFSRSLEVGAENGLLGVFFPRIPSRVDVDADERLGGLNNQRSAGGQLHSGLEEITDLRLDVELVEERSRLGIEVDATQELGVDLVQILLDLVVQLLGV